MCGRFAQHWEVSAWNEVWPAQWRVQGHNPRYNVAPGTFILAIGHDHVDQTAGGLIHWGLKTPRGFLINARSETVATRPTFRAMLAHGRVVIPMNGYYEWHRKSRIPYYIYGNDPLWTLGLAQKTSQGSQAVILTRDPTDALAAIHARMPMIVTRDLAEAWLCRSEPRYQAVLDSALGATPELSWYAISSRVNKSMNDGPDLIAPTP